MMIEKPLSFKGDVATSPLDTMGLIMRHMKELFKAIMVQVFVVKNRENNLIETIRFDIGGLPRAQNFDLWYDAKGGHAECDCYDFVVKQICILFNTTSGKCCRTGSMILRLVSRYV